MATVNLDDAKAHLREIISGLNPGEQLVIVEEGEPVATLTRSRAIQWPCKAGTRRALSTGWLLTSMRRSKISGSTRNDEPVARHAHRPLVLLG